MNDSIEITLPEGIKPVFPEQCIVCGNPPDNRTKIYAQTYNPFFQALMPLLIMFGWRQIEIPICKSCTPVFKAQRWGLVVASNVLGGIAVFWLLHNFNQLSLFFKIVSIPCVYILSGLPYLIAAFFFIPFFEATLLSDKVEYEFANIDFANAFHSLNEEHIIDSELWE